ncbi:phosphate ABC transporter permease PstA [Vibrio gazogenes]|uniref:Phosphate transport system permease protein PstA n=1 Tax=Vibrio gazogenes DSM 21264 = NBRC 103151 TaxID=1123492 RepID=A0A1M5G803_VIBGA|nr:phosphate ABC transporter permease PstA [Vibrio gazogenes]USP14368.1 phosphate ABC transporter permease PstA [Vibrio gazogenes]SHF99873.1 phosphate transport system permease protein [Vibrio gazogenes DSM 21264] [Vibrio gazogenes DSM 21264 = NBRC 103151]SJN59487.1 Phosphate transport system permease protein PstA [Vibrio gazogenes]
MVNWIKSGSPWIWLTGGAVSFSLLAVLGLLLLIGWKGLTYFWPTPLLSWQTSSGERVIGQLYDQDKVLASHLSSSENAKTVGKGDSITRLHIKIANRDIYPSDFISVLKRHLSEPSKPRGWAVIDRVRDGQFFGKPIGYQLADGVMADNIDAALQTGLREAEQRHQQIQTLMHDKVQVWSQQLEKLRLEKRKRELNHHINAAYLAQYEQQKSALEQQLTAVAQTLDTLREQLRMQALVVVDMRGDKVRIPVSQILNIWYPNDMSLPQKMVHWAQQVWHFVADNPRESNSEGGVFPAIFGTILLVIIMSVIVMPLGVVAAIYLHEYAGDNAFTHLIRVAVMNLAGVPSIVYGVFGLGFFVYTIGGAIDSIFYAERLPAPTFGTPGLLWSALTLAVLTLPVVIVATEEGLSRIPLSVRHGSLALGATQFETIWRVVLPMATPAMITGLILAVARAAGEVAPLMLVGVVKMASRLPVDNEFPFIHLERKFMHLGFHIYDVGFQTSNIEAARPLVFATSFLLVAVIVALNLTAISIRNNLREKYRTMGQD